MTMNPRGDTISFTMCNACGWKRWGRGDDVVLLSSVRPLLAKRLVGPADPQPPASTPARGQSTKKDTDGRRRARLASPSARSSSTPRKESRKR